MVGKCFMVHSGHQVFARFAERIGQYKAPPPGGALTEHFNRTMPDEDFACGYTNDVPNLYICDGSIFPTSTAVNPSLTIQAIAARAADRLVRTGPDAPRLARHAGHRPSSPHARK